MQMKKAAAISIGLHVAVLLWAVVSFSGKTLEATPAESLPVDVISEKDFSQMTKGVKDAPKPRKPKPRVEKKADEPKPVDKPVEEQKVKVSDKPEIKPTTEKQQPPPPEPKPEKQEKSEKQAKAAPEKPPEAVAKDKADPIAEKLQQDDNKIAKVAPKTPPRRPSRPLKEQPKFDATKIAALLDQREPRRQAVTGETLSPEASLGHVKGMAAQLSQSEIDALRARIIQCWQPPVGAENPDLQVVFHMIFNLDGTVKRGPDVVEGAPSALGPVFAESARRAILQCQPYTMLRREHYDQWQDMTMAFNLGDMLR
jgi:colicin import membrane protein